MSHINSDDSSNVIRVEFGKGKVETLSMRLRRATADMNESLKYQRRAVSEFQSTVEELGGEIASIERSLELYQRNLGTIGADRLGRKARRLARIMDSCAVPA
jgi:hypothetical protein